MAKGKKMIENKEEPKTETQDNSIVNVMSKLPFDVSFTLPNGQVRVIKGMKTSRLVGLRGEHLPTGVYQQTLMAGEEFEYYKKLMHDQPVIKNGVIFAEEQVERAFDKATDLSKNGAKTGFEQKKVSDLNERIQKVVIE